MYCSAAKHCLILAQDSGHKTEARWKRLAMMATCSCVPRTKTTTTAFFFMAMEVEVKEEGGKKFFPSFYGSPLVPNECLLRSKSGFLRQG